ncbi:hypothetical protein [Microtetraspora sp. NBRC 16547]|uniref:hypothetical protein n=1 Tax=Microtetraspora sp. NBRC 16547 TaxID=3030993 RepID=UPI0024A4C2C8|nr:hypothetical protein [Microtetraspora sp. NBRC 16547]GLW99608.1 hypothetical protein Misp02_36950 [Microtetraspora sp. NBRC 16547]
MRLPAALALAALCLAAACTSQAPRTAPTEEPQIYVLNLYGDENGRSDQRPQALVLSEFSTVSGMRWQSWGPSRAVGVGRLSGTWCLPQCQDRPYDATVTLSAVVPFKGNGYFTKYAIKAKLPAAQKEMADLAGGLPTPEDQ